MKSLRALCSLLALWVGSAARAEDPWACPGKEAGAPARDGRALVFEVPDAVDDGVKVPEGLEALGVPVTLKAVRTAWPIEDLVTYFHQTFEKAGLFVPPARLLSNPGWGPQVTGLDPDTRTTYTVLLQNNGDGTTTVIQGKARVGDRRDTRGDGAIAPVFPGALHVTSSNLEAVRALTYQAPGKPEEVTGFYRQVLGAGGYRELEPGVFERGGQLLRVHLAPGEDGQGTRVMVFLQLAPDSNGDGAAGAGPGGGR